jgi:hypothetical protein
MFNISTSVLTMLQPIVLFTPFTASLDAGSIAQKVGGELEYIISSSYLSLYRLEILSILLYVSCFDPTPRIDHPSALSAFQDAGHM